MSTTPTGCAQPVSLEHEKIKAALLDARAELEAAKRQAVPKKKREGLLHILQILEGLPLHIALAEEKDRTLATLIYELNNLYEHGAAEKACSLIFDPNVREVHMALIEGIAEGIVAGIRSGS